MNYGNFSTTTVWPTYRSIAANQSTTTTEPQLKQKLSIGVALSVVGNIMISVALNIQKHSHNKLVNSDKSYLKSPIWWTGMVLMVIGELGNFAAYGFAPASLVAPLGTTAVISNVIIAAVFLKEKLTKRNGIGITLAIIGAFLLVRFSNKKEEVVSAHEIVGNIKTLTFIVYILIELMVFLIILFLHHQLKYIKVVTILLQVALLGSLTVIAAKAVSSMISISFSGNNQLIHPIFYVMAFILIASAVGQVKFLNQAMAYFDATVVLPINFVFFTLSAIVSGIAFYQEFSGLESLQISMFSLGALSSFVGVYFISSGRTTPSKVSTERLSLVKPAMRPAMQFDLLPFPREVTTNTPPPHSNSCV